MVNKSSKSHVLDVCYPAPPTADGFLGYIFEYAYSLGTAFLLSIFVFLHKGFDTIHAHNPPDLFVLIAAFYKLLGKRFVYGQHDLSPELYFARFHGEGSQLIYNILIFFEKLSCFFADHVIATNQSYKKIEMQRGNVAEKKITIVRNGPDLDELSFTNVGKGAGQNKTTVCYVGDMGFHDGVDYLLRSLRCLLKDLKRKDFSCILVGAGDAWESLQSMSKELDLTDYVTFTGWVEQREGAHYIQDADICVAPEPSNSYNDRSTVIKIMEYMACGKSIAAFDLPEHRVTAKDAAIFAKPNDELDFARQIVTLMDNNERREKMGRIGRKRIETELAWGYQKEFLLKVYKQVQTDDD